MKQLSFDIKRDEEMVKRNYINYDWLTGNPDNLTEFFKKELSLVDLKPGLKIDAERRLLTLTKE